MSLTDECNKSSVVFNMNCSMRMKDYVENCPDDLTTRDHSFAPLVLGHKLYDYGCEPRTISRIISENANLFPFVYAFITQDCLWSKLIKLASGNDHLGLLCKTLNKFRSSIRHNNDGNLLTAQTSFRRIFNTLFQAEVDPLLKLSESLEECLIVNCNRSEVSNLPINCSRNDVVLIASTGSQGRDPQVPLVLTSVDGTSFHLTLISSDRNLSLRYGPPFYGFWTIKNNGSRPLKDPTLEYQYNRNWKFLIYLSQRYLTEETKLRYLKYMGGQGILLPSTPKFLIY